MLTYLKNIDCEGKLFLMRFEGKIGFVYTNTDHELYWQIGQHGDPWEVELAIVPEPHIFQFSLSGLVDDVETSKEVDECSTEVECETLFYLPKNLEWFTPEWECYELEDLIDED